MSNLKITIRDQDHALCIWHSYWFHARFTIVHGLHATLHGPGHSRAASERILVGNAVLPCGHQLSEVGQAGQAGMVEVEACWLADAGSQLGTL